MRSRSVVGLAVLAGLALDVLAIVLLESRMLDGRMDGGELLIRLSPLGALLFGSIVSWRAVRGGRSLSHAALTGAVGATLTFVIAWVPLIVLLVLYPPS